MSTKQTAQKDDISLVSANFGVKGWIILIITFLCIFLDSSLINDSLNVVVDVFAGVHQWNSNLLLSFSTITAWIAVAGAVIMGRPVQQDLHSLGLGHLPGHHRYRLPLLGQCLLPRHVLCLPGRVQCGRHGLLLHLLHERGLQLVPPPKKGMAMGWVTIGFPLSAAVTSLTSWAVW